MPTIEMRNLFQLPHLLKIPELVCNENCETILKFSLSEVATIWFSSGVAVHNTPLRNKLLCQLFRALR